MSEQWTTTSAPTLLRRDRSDSDDAAAYRVYDPDLLAGRNLTLAASGKTESPYDVAQGLAIIVLLAGSAIVAPAVFSDGGFWPTVLWTAAGLGAAFVVIMVLFFAFVRDPFVRYRKRYGENASPFLEVDTDDGPRAAALCALTESITSTAAWRDRAIDPERLVTGSLWSAVQLAVGSPTSARASPRTNGAGCHRRFCDPAARELGAARSDLDRVETNLREIGRIARELDAHRRPYGPGTGAGPAARPPRRRSPGRTRSSPSRRRCGTCSETRRAQSKLMPCERERFSS